MTKIKCENDFCRFIDLKKWECGAKEIELDEHLICITYEDEPILEGEL